MRVDPILREAARGRRCLFVAGLPGTGKSLIVRRIAEIVREGGRPVGLLRWDVARLAFDTPALLARYPEVEGVTHAAIRVAAGRWARDAVCRWSEAGADGALLVGETPLVGERFASLARRADDAVEPLLASDATLFLVPVPTAAVRARIESARERDASAPVGARDVASAAPRLVSWHWHDLVAVAQRLGIASALPSGYDPDLYAATFRRVLARRHARVVEIDEIVDAAGVVRAAVDESEIVPTSGDVAAATRSVEGMPPDEVDRAAAEWYRT